MGNGDSSFYDVIKWEFSRKHIWFSIFLRPEGDWFNSKQRATTLLMLIFNTVTVSAVLIEQEQKIGLGSELSWIIVTNLFVFPVPFLVLRLFGWRHENRDGDFVDEEHEGKVTKAVLAAGNIQGMSRTEQLQIRRYHPLGAASFPYSELYSKGYDRMGSSAASRQEGKQSLVLPRHNSF
eukprot:jgi/Bigna1/139044/aug1.48_g13752